MNPGDLRHRVTIEQPVRSSAAGGGVGTRWEVFAADVWAAVEPLEGSEALRGLALTEVVTARVRMRYRAGVTSAMRVVYQGRVLEIRRVADLDERHVEHELLCEEVR